MHCNYIDDNDVNSDDKPDDDNDGEEDDHEEAHIDDVDEVDEDKDENVVVHEAVGLDAESYLKKDKDQGTGRKESSKRLFVEVSNSIDATKRPNQRVKANRRYTVRELWTATVFTGLCIITV